MVWRICVSLNCSSGCVLQLLFILAWVSPVNYVRHGGHQAYLSPCGVRGRHERSRGDRSGPQPRPASQATCPYLPHQPFLGRISGHQQSGGFTRPYTPRPTLVARSLLYGFMSISGLCSTPSWEKGPPNCHIKPTNFNLRPMKVIKWIIYFSDFITQFKLKKLLESKFC